MKGDASEAAKLAGMFRASLQFRQGEATKASAAADEEKRKWRSEEVEMNEFRSILRRFLKGKPVSGEENPVLRLFGRVC